MRGFVVLPFLMTMLISCSSVNVKQGSSQFVGNWIADKGIFEVMIEVTPRLVKSKWFTDEILPSEASIWRDVTGSSKYLDPDKTTIEINKVQYTLTFKSNDLLIAESNRLPKSGNVTRYLRINYSRKQLEMLAAQMKGFAKKGDLNGVKSVLSRSSSPAYREFIRQISEMRGIYPAIENGQQEITKYLIENAIIPEKVSTGFVMRLVQVGARDVIKMLVENGMDVNRTDYGDVRGDEGAISILNLAAREGDVELMKGSEGMQAPLPKRLC